MNAMHRFSSGASCRRGGFASLLAVQVLLLGCREEGGGGSSVARRDSAGVEIVEIQPTTWPPPEVWQIEENPAVSIGVTTGDPDYELYAVQGTATTGNGGTVVAEFDATLRYYDRDGIHLRTLEREGEGPGEARSFNYLSGYKGDSLILTTMQGRGGTIHYRLLILDDQAEFGRNLDLRVPGSGEKTDSVVWVTQFMDMDQTSLADGSFALLGGTQIRLDRSEDGVVPGLAALVRADPNGHLMDTIDVVKVGSFEHQPLSDRKWGMILLDAEPPPPRANGMQVYWTPGDRYLVNVFEASPAGSHHEDRSTRLRRSIRLLTPLSPLTPEHRQEHIGIVVPTYDGDEPPEIQREYRDYLNGLPSPDSLPAIQDLRVDPLGNIWVELFEIPGKGVRGFAQGKGLSVQKEPARWVVFTSDGTLLGSVLTPPDLEIKEIGTDHILGITTDQYGAYQVRRHSIQRGPGGLP